MLSRGIAATSLAVCVSLCASPVADATQYYTRSFIKWGGSECLWVTSASYGNYWATSTDYVCDQDGDHQIVINTPALTGQWVGADPIIKPGDGVTWVGCSLIINGNLDFADFAEAGDGHNANCLRILK